MTFQLTALPVAPFVPLFALPDDALLSVRAFDAGGMLVDADVVEGRVIEEP